MGIIVGMSGASGSVYAVRLLEMLRDLGIERHLVATKSAALTLGLETSYTMADLHELASHTHSVGNLAASISSGSFRTMGMVVAPCSVKTLSGVVNCYEDNLLLRAAGVTLKEGRRLVLLFRETPLHVGHLRLLQQAAVMGATVFPPVPAFYTRPAGLDEVVTQTCGRVLDQFGLDAVPVRWSGIGSPGDGPDRALGPREV